MSDRSPLAYGDLGMVLRTLAANQRRLIAAIRLLAVPSGHDSHAQTRARSHLDAAIGQIEAVEALFAGHPDDPETGGTGPFVPSPDRVGVTLDVRGVREGTMLPEATVPDPAGNRERHP